MESYEFELLVRGYHVYKDTWEAEEDEILACIEDQRNRHDPYAVAVMKSKTVVGHLPRKISTVCFLGDNGQERIVQVKLVALDVVET